MKRIVLSAVSVAYLAGITHADHAPKVPPKSVVVSGSAAGKAVSFTCANPPTAPGGPSRARRLGSTMAAIKCIDPATKLEMNTTIKLGVGKEVLAGDESNGFLAFTLPPAGPGAKEDTISPTPRGTSLGKATTEITTWDEKTGHLVGSGTIKWEKDKTGKPGDVTVAFDLVLPPA